MSKPARRKTQAARLTPEQLAAIEADIPDLQPPTDEEWQAFLDAGAYLDANFAVPEQDCPEDGNHA